MKAPQPRAVRGVHADVRRFLPLLVLAMLLAALGAPRAPAADKTRAACFPAKSQTLAANSLARVYSRASPTTGDRKVLEACVFSKGVTVELDSPREGIHGHVPPGLVLNGTIVGYAVVSCFDDCSTSVEAIDLLKPSTENRINGSGASRRDEVVKVGSLTVTRAGGLAWIACPRGSDFELTRRWPTCVKPGYKDSVYRDIAGSTGLPERLDTGRDIDPASLRRKGSRVTWIAGGKKRSTTLK
jgi:hypothetical protein